MQTITLHHILLNSELLAQDLARELNLGAEFSELAHQYSACPSARKGGFAGYHLQDALPTSLITALADAEEGCRFIGPIKSSRGYHLLKPCGERPALILSEDEGFSGDSTANRLSAEPPSDIIMAVDPVSSAHQPLNDKNRENAPHQEPSFNPDELDSLTTGQSHSADSDAKTGIHLDPTLDMSILDAKLSDEPDVKDSH